MPDEKEPPLKPKDPVAAANQVAADTLAALDQAIAQKDKATREATLQWAPPAWRKLLDEGELPEDFNPWRNADPATLHRQATFSSGQQLTLRGQFATDAEMIREYGLERTRVYRDSKRAYYAEAKRVGMTDGDLRRLAKRYELDPNDLIVSPDPRKSPKRGQD